MLNKLITSIRNKSRSRKLDQFNYYLAPSPEDSILEVGVAEIEYSTVDNYLIKQYPYANNITALGIGDLCNFRTRYPLINTVSYDGRSFPFKDDQFSIAHSNAVIEHVGSRQNQRLFLSEIIRVSNRGMLTTPNRFFPFETHTRIPILHWLPKSLFDTFLLWVGKQWATGNFMNLLSYRQVSNILSHIPGVSFRIMKNRLLFFTMTFTVIWEKPALKEGKAPS